MFDISVGYFKYTSSPQYGSNSLQYYIICKWLDVQVFSDKDHKP